MTKMQCTTPGHSYELEVYDHKPYYPFPFRQYLFFMKRIGENYPGNIPPGHPGTNCQEVLRVLIDRLKYLNDQIPCSETEACIDHARRMIWELEARAKRMKGKSFVGVHIELIETYPTCKTCGHIFCTEMDHLNGNN